jgi:L-asparaginase
MTSRISVIATGGTVAMTTGPSGLRPTQTAADLVAAVGGGVGDLALEVVDAMAVPSANLGFDDVERLARLVERETAGGARGVVIVQGTDTLEETAFALELMLEGRQSVCLTGAMRGAGAPGADGPGNLSAAIRTAASLPLSVGVCVVMNDGVHAARYVAKTHTTALDAFTSHDFGLLGRIHEGELRLSVDTLPALGSFARSDAGGWPKIALLRVAMGDDDALVRHVASGGYEGCVIEAMGAGHVPARLAPALGDLCLRMPVVLASRVGSGRICERTYGYPGSETDLLGRGLISAGALSGLKARVLLTLCLRARRPEMFERITGLI